jgi:hypothetical protein
MSDPPATPGAPKSPAFHVAWATVALAIIVGGTVVALRGLRVAENTGPAAVQALGDLLAPRIEVSLRTNLAILAGSPQSFLVAHTQGGHLSATSDETLHTILGIELGTIRARVEWDFTVDLGMDLSEMDAGSFTVECDADGRVCQWYVPDPSGRPPSIRTETMVVSVDGAALVSDRVEQDNADRLVSRVTELTETDVRSETFWSVARENVRSSLVTFARDRMLEGVPETAEDPPAIEVVFESERRRERPAPEPTGR